MQLSASSNVGADGLVEFRIGGFELCPERLRTLMNSTIG